MDDTVAGIERLYRERYVRFRNGVVAGAEGEVRKSMNVLGQPNAAAVVAAVKAAATAASA